MDSFYQENQWLLDDFQIEKMLKALRQTNPGLEILGHLENYLETGHRLREFLNSGDQPNRPATIDDLRKVVRLLLLRVESEKAFRKEAESRLAGPSSEESSSEG